MVRLVYIKLMIRDQSYGTVVAGSSSAVVYYQIHSCIFALSRHSLCLVFLINEKLRISRVNSTVYRMGWVVSSSKNEFLEKKCLFVYYNRSSIMLAATIVQDHLVSLRLVRLILSQTFIMYERSLFSVTIVYLSKLIGIEIILGFCHSMSQSRRLFPGCISVGSTFGVEQSIVLKNSGLLGVFLVVGFLLLYFGSTELGVLSFGQAFRYIRVT